MVVSFCWLDATCGQIINNRHGSDNFITGAAAYIESTRKAGILGLKFVKNMSTIRAEVKNNNSHKYQMPRCSGRVSTADVTLRD